MIGKDLTLDITKNHFFDNPDNLLILLFIRNSNNHDSQIGLLSKTEEYGSIPPVQVENNPVATQVSPTVMVDPSIQS